jgi:hypothetical protein
LQYQNLEAEAGGSMSLRLAWTTQQDPASKNQNPKTKIKTNKNQEEEVRVQVVLRHTKVERL